MGLYEVLPPGVSRRIIDGVERIIVMPPPADVDIRELNRRMMAEMIEEYSAPGEPLPPELQPGWEPDVEDVGRAEDERRRWKAAA